MWLWGALVAGVLIAFLYALKIFFTPKPRNQANISGNVSTNLSAREPGVPMISLAEIRAEYQRGVALFRQESAQLQAEITAVERLDFSKMSAAELVRHAKTAEQGNLAATVGLGVNAQPGDIVDALRKADSHSLPSWFRRAHVPYEEVVFDVAKKAGATVSKQQPVQDRKSVV